MSEQDIRRSAEEHIAALNAHDAARYVDNLDESYTWESDSLPESPLRGRDAVRRYIQANFEAFPDLHFDIEQTIIAGDTLVMRWRASGTHQGTFLGIPATNRRVDVSGCTIAEYQNGRPVRVRSYWDTGRMMRQMGVIGAQARAAG